jgi:hypothetical protein
MAKVNAKKEIDSSLKAALGRWRSGMALPPPPSIPINLQGAGPDMRLLWELNERVKLLEGHYKLMGKVVWRTSAALLGLLVPSLGWDTVENILKLMGN